MMRTKSLLTRYFSGLLFVVRVEGESLWPHIVPGRRYLTSSFFVPHIGDIAVFRNPRAPQEVFAKRVAAVRDGAYIMESTVSWGSSSDDFGIVPRRLIVGKLIL